MSWKSFFALVFIASVMTLQTGRELFARVRTVFLTGKFQNLNPVEIEIRFRNRRQSIRGLPAVVSTKSQRMSIEDAAKSSPWIRITDELGYDVTADKEGAPTLNPIIAPELKNNITIIKN